MNVPRAFAADATRLSVTEASRSFADMVNRARYRGERFLLTKGGVPVAELRPVGRVVLARDLAAVWRAMPRLAVGDAERMAADVRAARRKVGRPGATRWD